MGRGALVLIVLCGLLGADSSTREHARTCVDEHPAYGPLAGATPHEFVELTTALLDSRTEAVMSGDEQQFLAGIDPAATALLAEQRRYFENLQQLPLDGWSYDLLQDDRAWEEIFDEAAGSYTPYVALRYQLHGYDAEEVAQQRMLRFARAGAGWCLAADLSGTQQGYLPEPWDLDDISVAEGTHALVVGAAEDAGLIAEMARVADEVVPRVSEVLPVEWDQRVVIYADPDETLREAWRLRRSFAYTVPRWTQASRLDLHTPGLLAGVRVLDADGAVIEPATMVGHEATHVAYLSTWNLPRWLSEGTASYVEARVSSEQLDTWVARMPARVRDLTAPPGSGRFYARRGVFWRYAWSWGAVEVIADRVGTDGLDRLIDAMQVRGGADLDARSDAVLRRVVGIDGIGLAAATSRWLAQRATG